MMRMRPTRQHSIAAWRGYGDIAVTLQIVLDIIPRVGTLIANPSIELGNEILGALNVDTTGWADRAKNYLETARTKLRAGINSLISYGDDAFGIASALLSFKGALSALQSIEGSIIPDPVVDVDGDSGGGVDAEYVAPFVGTMLDRVAPVTVRIKRAADRIEPPPPPPPPPAESAGMSGGAKAALAVGGVGIVGLVIFLLVR